MNNLSCQEIDHHHYQKFISNTPHSAFQELQWLDLVARHYSCEIRLLGCYEKDKLIAVIPLMGRHMGPFQIWGSPLRKIPIPPSTCFCAPSSQWQPALSCLEQWLSTSRLKYIQITLPPGSTLSSRRWKSEQLDNLELKLDPPLGILWSQLSTLPRRCVRKAVRNGVRAHWCCSPQFLKHHSKMLKDTYGPQGRPPHIYGGFYEDLCRTRNEHHLSVLYATYKGTYIASIWVIRDSTTCYYWDAAATSSGRKLNANHLLVWLLIRWAKKRNLSVLDFVGTPTGGEGNSRPGIGRFKRSMGGAPVSRQILYHYTPLFGAALRVYRLWNRLRKSIRHLFTTRIRTS